MTDDATPAKVRLTDGLGGRRRPEEMKDDNGFWSHEPQKLEGWQQLGDVHGSVFGCWFQPPNSAISIGDESRRYWLRIGNCYYGSHMTPEDAAKKAREIQRRAAAKETPNVEVTG